MSIVELFILAVGLSMDAFAVSICKGLSLGKIKPKHMCIAGIPVESGNCARRSP